MSVLDASGAARRAVCLIELFEDGGKFRDHPYRDQGGTWTIGTGLTTIDGRRVGPTTGMITQSEDDADVAATVDYWLKVVERLIAVDLSAVQAAALVSLAYNCGEAPLLSTANVGYALIRGEYLRAANAFSAWCHVRGVVVDGLVIRRDVERQVFLGELDPLDRAALLAAQEKYYRAIKRANGAAKSAGASVKTTSPNAAGGPASTEPTADELMNIYNPQ